jgi:nicotinic acid mononucleotide adenylyltransferase
MRPGVSRTEIEAVRARLGADDRIVEFEMEPVAVSSTEIRGRVARGEPVDALLPRAVAEAVSRQGLYR